MIVLPQQISKYLSTNLAQPFPEWVSTASYTADTQVLYKNYIYRNIVDSNQGVQPDLNTGKWLLMGVDNSYAAIDLNSSTTTTIDEDLTQIELTFEAVSFSYLAFGQIQGSLLTVEEYNSGDVLLKTKDYPIGVARINALNWYEYYYNPIPDTSGAGSGLPIDVLIDLIQPTTSYIKIILMPNGAGECFISSMVGGEGKDIGATQYGVQMSLLDYSRKETDDNGITTLTRKKSRETMDAEIITPSIQIQGVKRIIKAVLGTSLMFIADPDSDSKFDNLIILGYVESFDMYLDNGIIARSRMRIEEVL